MNDEDDDAMNTQPRGEPSKIPSGRSLLRPKIGSAHRSSSRPTSGKTANCATWRLWHRTDPPSPAIDWCWASSSDYMNALLSEDRFRDSTDCPVNLPDVSPDAVRLLLNWFYRGECLVGSFADCAALLEAANQLQCQALITELQMNTNDVFGVDHCVRLFRLSKRLDLDWFWEEAFNIALKNFADLVMCDDFRDLGHSDFLAIMEGNNWTEIIIDDEKEAYEAVMKWAKGNMERDGVDQNEVSNNVCKLLAEVRFPFIDKDYVQETVLNDPLIISNPTWIQAVAHSLANQNNRACVSTRCPTPVTIRMIYTAFFERDEQEDTDIFMLHDASHCLERVRLIGAVRERRRDISDQDSFWRIEDGTGVIAVLMNQGCTGSETVRLTMKDYAYVCITGRPRCREGRREIVADSIRLLDSGNELIFHMQQVVCTAETFKLKRDLGLKE